MTAATPGQAALGEPPALYARWHRVDTGPGTPDEMIAENWRVAFKEDREFWTELDAQLAAAQEPHAAAGGRSFEDMLTDPREQFDLRSELLTSISEYAAAPPASAGIKPWHPHGVPQPAPGIPLRSDAETADMLRADLADAEAQLARWPKCPAGCNCRIGTEDDPDRNECGCDGPCNGGEQPAPGLANAIAEARRYRDALQEVRAIILEGGNSTEGSRLRRSRAVIRKSLEGK